MTTTTIGQPRRWGGLAASIIGGIARRLLATYRLGARRLIAAPLIVALVAVPELVQHFVEIKMGMFASQAAFKALAFDPTRWAFGYAKLAGLWLAMLARRGSGPSTAGSARC